MKQFFKNHICFIRKIIILLPVICLIGICLFFSTDTDTIEKYSFTNKEISSISDVIQIRCNTIEKMIGAHGKDCVFIIYISDYEEQDLDINYTKKSTIHTDNRIIYEENNTNNDKRFPTTCYFGKYEEQDVLVVEFHGHNSTLHNIVPQPSLVIYLFIFVIFSIYLIVLVSFIFSKIKNLIIRIKNKKIFNE